MFFFRPKRLEQGGRFCLVSLLKISYRPLLFQFSCESCSPRARARHDQKGMRAEGVRALTSFSSNHVLARTTKVKKYRFYKKKYQSFAHFCHRSMFSTQKRCLTGFLIYFPSRKKKKKRFWAQKRQNLAQNWHFGPNIGIFGPLDLMPDQKTSCRSGFLLCWYQNFYLLP